jgi:tRNA A-37 threonylcarbamoyl transferase component Bud32
VREDLEPDLIAAGLGDPGRLTRRVARGQVARVETPAGRVVLRPYRRGGIVGGLSLPHRSPRRFADELRAALEARRRGLPVPEPLVVVARRSGPGWHGWIVYREVPGAQDLRAALRAAGAGAEAAGLLGRALRLLRQAHDAGLEHPDLSLGNLLVEGEGSGALWIVDLDRAGFGPPRTPRGRFDDVSRLDRSVEKLFGDGLLDRQERDRLMVGYAEGDPVLERFFRSRLSAHARRLARHRRLWPRPGRRSLLS